LAPRTYYRKGRGLPVAVLVSGPTIAGRWGPEWPKVSSRHEPRSGHWGSNKDHLPTARIAFEDVLRSLIEEFDVEPAKELDVCRRIQSETQQRHEKHRTWWGVRKP
jgi:hypothetical protein